MEKFNIFVETFILRLTPIHRAPLHTFLPLVALQQKYEMEVLSEHWASRCDSICICKGCHGDSYSKEGGQALVFLKHDHTQCSNNLHCCWEHQANNRFPVFSGETVNCELDFVHFSNSCCVSSAVSSSVHIILIYIILLYVLWALFGQLCIRTRSPSLNVNQAQGSGLSVCSAGL